MLLRHLPRTRVAARSILRSNIRAFHNSKRLDIVKPFILADIGEGIKECEVIQWFVESGARIEEFEPICEVQSDKASVEITSRYSGVIKSLHYEVGQMALVGKPLVDIDVEDGTVVDSVEAPVTEGGEVFQQAPDSVIPSSGTAASPPTPQVSGKFQSLATPSVRRVSKELNVDITQINGTGKDGRVLKEDVIAYHKALQQPRASSTPPPVPVAKPALPVTAEETVTPLTPVQAQMFKAMSGSLSIPHFLYTDEVRLDTLTKLRARFNADALSRGGSKMSYMPFFIKAMSVAISEYPVVNSRVTFENEKPMLVSRPQHNIGIAMDTPAGLIVPNIKNVQALSISEIAAELSRLQESAKTGKFASADLKGGTISLSNIGTVGGTYLSPVIVDSEVAILAVGRARTVPLYKTDGSMEIAPTQVFNTSWSGDHRVLDGVTLAKTAERFKNLIEDPELLLLSLR